MLRRASFGGRGKRAGDLRSRLLWLPLAAALYIVAITPATEQTLYDSGVYLDQAGAIARGEIPSGRYPPGFAVTLAAGHAVGLTAGQVGQLTTMALAVLVVVAARRIGGPASGAVAGVLCCASPWLTASSRYVMSDPLAAVAAVGGLLAVLARRPVWAAVTTVCGVLVRLLSGVGIVAMLAMGKRWVIGAAVGAAVLFGGFQWAASGSPFTTGYDQGGASWSPGFVLGQVRGDGPWVVDGAAAKAGIPNVPEREQPNLIAYPSMVLGMTYSFGPPFLSLIGGWALWRRRSTPAARFTAWWMAASLAVLLPYFAQSVRLIAPAMMLLTVYTAAGIVDLIGSGAEERGGAVDR